MIVPDIQSSATPPETPGYAAYAQLIKMLLPSTGCIVFYDSEGDMAWCSHGFDRPDLRELVESLSAQADVAERNRGSVRRTADGSAALVARLADGRGRELGYALIELGPAHATGHSMASSLTRPLLEILSAQLASIGAAAAHGHAAPAPRPAAAAPVAACAPAKQALMARLDLLLSLAEVDPAHDDAVRLLLDRCTLSLRLAGAAFCMPSRGLTVVAERASNEPAQRTLLDSTRRHLLAWAQLNNKPMIVNRVGSDRAKAQFKILTCPVPDADGPAGGLLALFRPPGDEDFELIDVRLAEFVTRQAMGVLRERHDAATGLASAAAFERAVTRCLAARAGGALLHIELDDLRGIDASFGLRAGDAIVSRVAELIGRRLNENGRACRFPDARFAVLLPDRSEAEALAFGNELAARVAALDYRCNDRAVAVSLRWGVAAPPAGATAARHWIAAAADRASAFGVADTSSTYNGVPV